MPKIIVNKTELDIDLMVFDKDGLMFKSQPFWKEIADERIKKLKKYLDEEGVMEWAQLFGLSYINGETVYTDPSGILAVATPMEERSITGSIIAKKLNLTWSEAKSIADTVFLEADRDLNLKKALVATEGFPDILGRLRTAGILYGVATSDTEARVIESFRLLGEEPPELIIFPEMVQNGKPAPDMLLLAAQKMDVPINRIAMVGDSLVDVQMAKNAGAIGIGVPETVDMRERMRPYSRLITCSLKKIII